MVKYRSENTAADVGLFEGSTDVLGAASAGGRDKPPSRTLHINHKRHELLRDYGENKLPSIVEKDRDVSFSSSDLICQTFGFILNPLLIHMYPKD